MLTAKRLIFLSLVVAAACTSTQEFVGMTADEAFAYAQRRFEEEDYGKAIAALERIAASQAEYARMPEVRLLMAESYYQDGDRLTAVSEFTRVLSRYPASPQAPTAALGVCRSYVALAPIPQRDQTFTQQALTACQNTAGDYAGTDIGEEAGVLATRMLERLAEKDFAVAESYFRLKFYDSARIYYEDVVAQFPGTTVAPRALLRLVELFTRIEYDDLAEQHRQRLLTDYPDSPSAKQLQGVSEARTSGG